MGNMKELILGSQSPRRREILNFFSVPFVQKTPNFDETRVPFHGDPESFVCEVAMQKALSLYEMHPDHPILTADTVVAMDGRLFLKPESREEAFGMLRELSGKKHSVFTGVCVVNGEKRIAEAEEACVEFHSLSDQEIRAYQENFHPLDKAGAYAIQRGGSVIVKRIEGCYYNIMGLPLNKTRSLLGAIGINLWEFLKPL